MLHRAANEIPTIPDRLRDLATLASNLWWSWSREGRGLFREIDLLVWRQTRHNPIEMLRRVDPERLAECANDPAFVDRYDQVMAELRATLDRQHTWFGTTQGDLADRTIAYFCAEFGLHTSVPIYSGGLGLLAGDHCKTASDLGVPLVGVGLMYTRGYFDQRVGPSGWQEDSDEALDPALTPLVPVLDADGAPALVTVRAFGRDIAVGAWKVMAGAVPIYLLDTDLDRNDPDDRGLTHRLYAGGPDLRLRQEWLLGAGGVRLLRRLGIHPAAWHANEGHATFMLVERLRESMVDGMTWDDALASVRATSVFTTHTPVAAGHDQFAHDETADCIGPVWEEMGVDRDTLLSIGNHPEDGQVFHMTAAAIRLSGHVNGVSRLHGAVTRDVWHHVWPDRDRENVPIRHVTNGVHLATWMANPMMDLLDGVIGPDWGTRRHEPDVWRGIFQLDDEALWNVHQWLKQEFLEYVREDTRRRWRDRWPEPARVAGAGVLLGPHALTIGFARRFATYKRADLPFRDADRLRRLLTDPRRPVQLVFAGKAHPADDPGKHVLQRVYQYASDPAFEGRVTFLEDYEMHVAHRLVQGVDLWLNLPRPPLEACGTSGMKAALNGVPQLGTLDGWWAEGFTGSNGWAIPRVPTENDDVDAHDAEHMYRVLEEEIVPAFYDRREDGVPSRWVDYMKHALVEAGQHFSGQAMMQQYVQDYYVPCMSSARHAWSMGRADGNRNSAGG